MSRRLNLCNWRGCRERASRYLCRSHFNALPFSIQHQLIRAETADEKLKATAAVIAYMTTKTLPAREVAPPFCEPKEQDHA